MSKVFANPLVELIEYEELNQELERGNGPLQVSGCMDSQKVHLIQETAPSFPWKLVVTYDDSRAKEIYEDFRCFQNSVYLRILAASDGMFGCIRQRICCFTVRIFMGI